MSTALQILEGRCWGDECCYICGVHADLIVHLTWPDGVDEDYRESCFDHRADCASQMVKAYRRRRYGEQPDRATS